VGLLGEIAMYKRVVAISGLVAILSGISISNAYAAAGPTQKELDDAATDAKNWVYVDHDYHGQRYSPLKEINGENADKLAQTCSFTFPEKEPAQTAPIAYDGVLYATTAHHTVALDGATCKVIWQSDWKPRGHETFNTQRGAAIKDGKLVRGTADGYLLALDAKTGDVLWSRQIAEPADGHFISMPPLIVDDLVIIGPAGSEWAAKGWVGAFRLTDGAPVWKFNIIPDPDDEAAKTWGDNPKVLATAGGNLWTPLSYDPEMKLVYVPGGNPAPDFYDKDRPGDNLYTNSLIALDVETGKLAWYYQAVPHDTHDYDQTHTAPVFETTIDGNKKTVIVLTGKDGLLRLFDRDSHKLIYAVPFTTRTNADQPLTMEDTHVCPAALGGHEWNGAAYSPNLQTLFVPSTDWCATMKMGDKTPESEKEHTGGAYYGGDMKFDPLSQARGWLTAFDAATGKEKWKYAASKPMIGGVAATGGDVVFTGELTGDFRVFDARNGKTLYTHNVGGQPIAGGVMSYEAAGHQYVAIVSGYVGYYNLVAPEIGGANPTVTVFTLEK
jgi:alcohol dehydrogenase (cytochrome c)